MARAWPRSPAAPTALAAVAWLRLAFVLVVVFPTQAAKLAVQLVAAFEPHQHHQFARILHKATNDVNGDPRFNFTLVGMPINVSTTPGDTMKQLCSVLDTTNLTGLVVLAERPHTFAAATVAGYSGLPIVGASQGYADHTFKDVSPLFVALNPSLDHVADAVSHLLKANHWLASTYLGDESVTSVQLWARLRATTSDSWTQIVALTVPRVADEVADMLSDAAKLRGRVLLLHCDRERARHVFQEAARLNMVSGEWIWLLLHDDPDDDLLPEEYFPTGLLALQLRPLNITKHVVRAAVRLFALGLRDAGDATVQGLSNTSDVFSCWFTPSQRLSSFSVNLYRAMHKLSSEIVSGRQTFDGGGERIEGVLNAHFDILNLREDGDYRRHWRLVGNVSAGRVQFDAVTWPGNLVVGPHSTANNLLRVVAAIAPPFVMESTLIENRTCLKGVPCMRVTTNNTAQLAVMAAEFRADRDLDPTSSLYNVTCCCGHSIDLLMSISRELQFDYVLYLVADGHFGGKRGGTWNGIIGDLISGAAHLAFAPLSVTSIRAQHVDYSVPYFYSGVKLLTSYKLPEIPLHAFLLTFSPYLWIAIFASLNTTAMAAAVYEWLSPFGLNPWGRQRTKNFSMASALWVMWSLLFSHLVAFKAPKSWPNKVLINLWGCFSVIFLASYTANIARLFAGLFFQQSNVNNFHDSGLLSQRVGTVRYSSSETYVAKNNEELWQHMVKFSVENIEDGVYKLRNGELDWLIGDTPILDYYRSNDPGCQLEAITDIINEDSYAIGMPKGSSLKDPVSKLIIRFNENGYLDYVNDKWFRSSPCNRREVRPVRLSIGAVAGVFIMLGVGILVGCLILVLEHLVFKHALPRLRKKPKGSRWRSPNLMFLSQKLYRFINCVELVSPHHSAKELVNNLRTGQITSLFQKSVKRKEHEQRRRRKSKAQFFEMIQEIRRVQKEGKESLASALRRNQITEEVAEDEERVDLKLEAPPQPGRRKCSLVDRPVYLSDDSCSRLILHTPCTPGDDDDGAMDEEDEDEEEEEEDEPPSDSDSDVVARFSPISTSLNDLSPYGLVYGDESYGSRGVGLCPGPSGSGRCKSSRVRSFDDLQLLTAIAPCQEPLVGAASTSNNCLMREVSASLDFGAIKLDERRLRRLTKEDIVLLWQSSERHLRKRLLHALQEKAELESKLAVLQRALLHPP